MKRESEHKHVTTVEGFVTSSVGTIGGSLVALTQGTSNGTRIGSQVQLMQLNIRARVTLPGASTGDNLRCILVCDHGPAGGTFFPTDIIEAADMLAPYNLDKVTAGMGVNRFSILLDRTLELSPASPIVASGTGARYRDFNKSFKLDSPIHYAGNAGTVSDLVKNNYAWLVISQNGQALWNCRSQICYVDV